MESSLYSYSLCIALPLMLFFGFEFLLARTPEKLVFENYLCSRRMMGVAILLLAANYSIHFFCGIRFKDVDAAILINLCPYFLCYWLFSSALITLLDRFYITRRRTFVHIGLWIIFSLLACIVLMTFPKGPIKTTALFGLSAWLVIYGLVLARRILRAYHKAINIFNDTNSDDIGAYIRWLSVFTYWAIIFGVGCGILTFLPNRYVYVWILSSVPFYIYLFHCYQNYLLFYERVEHAMESEVTPDLVTEETKTEQKPDSPIYHAEIAEKIKEWIANEGYVHPGLTIKELSDAFLTNRTYLSEFIRTEYGTTFRDWITGLRIEYAKRLLVENPKLIIADVSEQSGFMSPSHFIRLFKENEGCTPNKWRKTK